MPQMSTNRIHTFISSFIRESSNAKDPESLLLSLIKIVQKFVNCQWVAILDKDFNLRKSDSSNISLEQDLLDMIKWSVEKMSPTSLVKGQSTILIFPLVKTNRVLGVLLAATNEEPVFEIFELIRTLAFLSSVVLENLDLYKSLEKQHAVVEETMNYMQRIFNSFPQIVVVLDSQLKPIFSNIQYLQREKESKLTDAIEKVAKNVLATNSRQVSEIESEGTFYSLIAEKIEYEGETQVLLSITDVTNTKELERLKAIDKLKTDFVASISHELRTPLAAIKAYSETMLSSLSDLDKDILNDFLQIVYKESLHLESLLDELLDFAKIEQKAMSLEKTKFNLAELIQEVIQSMTEFAKSKNVRLECDVSEPIFILADRKRIRQVLINLVSNGVKYSKENGNDKFVKISTKIDNAFVIISISDNGIGIPEEYQQKVFEKFFRVGSALDYRTEGAGIGLTITKEIVELHGGRIWLESKVNDGSVFYVQLPLGE
ncbi:sensor histidine kinase [Thermotoga profunda]|uniref:sensor histidine kinase n=1 Tax=Thermotoga profunda TaxID=1508420 RepID=UPI0006943E86|nr:HAMP domain-containing sensor histidine kinase [Thermotoga profunda]